MKINKYKESQYNNIINSINIFLINIMFILLLIEKKAEYKQI
jgi:hypothetical protein